MSMMLDLVSTVLDLLLLLHGCLIVSVSSFLIVLVLQPLAGNVASASRSGICSASRSVIARLQPSRDAACDGGAVAPPPPPPRRPRRRHRNCKRCAASWSGVVAVVATRLCLQEDDDTGGDCSPGLGDDGAAAGCGGCAAAAAVEELLERKEATESELREAFYVFDRDEDGFVSADELWNVLRRLGMPEGAAQEDCARMISAHDSDGDGRISFREFRAMMEDAV